ncbi:hypothetical protein PCE1_003367 [Barthelona sp. PCE]
MVSGASVISIVYNGGILIGSDTILSSGKMLRYNNIQRVHKVTEQCVMIASGDYADFQLFQREIDRVIREQKVEEYNYQHDAREIHQLVSRIQYNASRRVEPLYNDVIIAGITHDAVPYIGSADLQGTSFSSDRYITSGFSLYICQPILEEKWEENMTQDQAFELMCELFHVLYARHALQGKEFQVTCVSEDGVETSEKISAELNWDWADDVMRFTKV